MKRTYLLLALLLASLCSPCVSAEEKDDNRLQETPNTVVLYFFWGSGCPYCAAMMPFIDNMSVKYPNLEVKKREVWRNQTNSNLLSEMAAAYDVTVSGVPATFLSDIYYRGYATSQNTQIENRIVYCSNHACESADYILAEYRGGNTTTTTITSTTRTSSTTTGIATSTTIRAPGDANSDGEVNYSDLILLAATYGKETGEAGYDSRADFNGDGSIEYEDLILLATNYEG